MGSGCEEKRIFFVESGGVISGADSWDFDRSKTCCFTGHRPENLPGGASRDSLGYMNMRSTAALHIYGLIKRGYTTFIIGMSRGFDLEMGGLLLEDSRLAGSVRIVCAVPYMSQIREMKTARERELYKKLLEASDAAAVCSRKYFDGCYKTRNQFMVNSSSAIIGYMKSPDFRSGALQTVNMARRAGLEMHIMYGSENPQFTEAD